MKKLFCYVLLSAALSGRAAGYDSLRVVFWNLENFFDYMDGGQGESDRDFSSFGERRWTRKRFYAKCDAVAKAILWTADRYGGLPDVIGVAEVENLWVLRQLLSSTSLRKYGYGIVHADSPDRRGIDVALLYLKSSLEVTDVSVKLPVYMGKRMETRYILHVGTVTRCGRKVDFIVNHHPSKFGGGSVSAGKRKAAMEALVSVCDSINEAGASDCIIGMGDFNDTPDGGQFRLLDGILCNKAMALHEAGKGTIRYGGKWELIDMFLVSGGIDACSEMDICMIPFLLVRDRGHPGYKPFRTYSGPRYIGGVSDHCPVILRVGLPVSLREPAVLRCNYSVTLNHNHMQNYMFFVENL